MSKQVLNTVTAPLLSESILDPSQALSDISQNIDALLYSPTPTAKKLKARFWNRYTPSFLDEGNEITPKIVAFYIKDNRIEALWSKPGFKDWFLNKDEGREKLEYLFMLALEKAEEILTSEGVQPSAAVNMIKVVGELANKFPSKTAPERFSDEDINKMSPEQLELYIKKSTSGAKRDVQILKELEQKV